MPMVPAKPKTGRPSKLTPSLTSEFLGYIENGSTQADAAAIVGVDVATIRRWVADGRRALDKSDKTGQPVPDDLADVVAFHAAFTCARARYGMELHSALRTNALAGETPALIYLLKVHDPDRYSLKQKIEAELSTSVVTLYPTTEGRMSTTLVLPEDDE